MDEIKVSEMDQEAGRTVRKKKKRARSREKEGKDKEI